MLVGERMSKSVVYAAPETPIQEALQLMNTKEIRRLPVLKNGKLVGIVSEKDLLNASPSMATSLSVWELNYLLSKITVAELMTKEVITVNEDTPIEEAATIMADRKVGGVPVMSGSDLVGMITETDLFCLLLEITGARESGIRATFLLEDQPGELAELAQVIAEQGGNVIAIGTYAGDRPATREVVLKVNGLKMEEVEKSVLKVAKEIKDIRSSG